MQPTIVVLEGAVKLRIISYFIVVLAAACVTSQGVAGQVGRAALAPAHSQLVEDLVVANHILANEGIVDGLGHVSVRDERRPDRFLMARDMAPGLVTADDVMEFDLDGAPVDARGRQIYAERFIHSAIYRARPDINSVIYSHTPSVLPFTTSNVPLRPMYNQSAFLLAGVPMFEIRRIEGATGMLVRDAQLGSCPDAWRQGSRADAGPRCRRRWTVHSRSSESQHLSRCQRAGPSASDRAWRNHHLPWPAGRSVADQCAAGGRCPPQLGVLEATGDRQVKLNGLTGDGPDAGRSLSRPTRRRSSPIR